MAISYTPLRATLNNNDPATPVDAAWGQNVQNAISALYSLVNAKGDLVLATAADTLERLAVGSNNYALVADSSQTTGVKWVDLGTLVVPLSILTAKGDILAASGSGAVDNLAVGTNGQVLTADSAQTLGIKWATAATEGPAFSAYASADQTISTSTNVKVNLNAEEFDTSSYFDSTTNYRYTPLVAGYYLFTWSALILSIADQQEMFSMLWKNGGEFKRNPQIRASGSSSLAGGGSALVAMNGSTDFVELYVRHSHGSDRTLSGTSARTYLAGFRVRSL